MVMGPTEERKAQSIQRLGLTSSFPTTLQESPSLGWQQLAVLSTLFCPSLNAHAISHCSSQWRRIAKEYSALACFPSPKCTPWFLHNWAISSRCMEARPMSGHDSWAFLPILREYKCLSSLTVYPARLPLPVLPLMALIRSSFLFGIGWCLALGLCKKGGFKGFFQHTAHMANGWCASLAGFELAMN